MTTSWLLTRQLSKLPLWFSAKDTDKNQLLLRCHVLKSFLTLFISFHIKYSSFKDQWACLHACENAIYYSPIFSTLRSTNNLFVCLLMFIPLRQYVFLGIIQMVQIFLLHFGMRVNAKFTLTCFAMKRKYILKVAEELTRPLVSPNS